MSDRILLRFHKARKRLSCTANAAPWCNGIKPGDRYCIAALPPNSSHDNEGWGRVRECPACLEWFGHANDELIASPGVRP